MNFKLFLFIVLLCGISLPLAAQRQDDAVEVKVANMQPTPYGVSVTLRAADNADDSVQLMIGFPEGQSMSRAIHHQNAPRPASHDLFKAFLDRNGWTVQKVLIKELKDGTFLADLTLKKDGETQVYDARPSDAMAIGLRFDAKIYVNPQVFDEQKKGQDERDKDDDDDLKKSPDQLKL